MAAALAAAAAPLGGGPADSCCARDLPPYEVVDGLAIHDGDIVLGTEEEVAGYSRLVAPSRHRDTPREIALPHSEPSLWPDGVVPYVIDEALPEGAAESVRAAISEWNAKTVITLTPRASETDFIVFVQSAGCRSYIGRKGGEQRVWSGGDGVDCGPGGMTHEIGHAIGLDHEHQRSDRDRYVTVAYSDIDPRRRQSYTASSRPAAAYDFRSTMHYSSNFLESIPPGIEMPSAGLSAGDIDGVARLYGQPPPATVIATNPPGLTVWVDGTPVEAPARFNWEAGIEHTLEVPAEPQGRGVRRYVFARWNDSAPRKRTVIAGGAGTWLEANFIAQHRVRARTEPPDAGVVTVTPPHEWHTAGTDVRFEAAATNPAHRRFWGWNLPHPPTNPAAIRAHRLPEEVIAYFTGWPLYRVASNVPAFHVYIDGRLRAGPAPVAITTREQRAAVRIASVQAARDRSGSRYRFERWSDGVDDREREIALPPDGGDLTAIFSTEHRLQLGPSRPTPAAGEVVASPGAEDGYYPAGTAVTLTAAPNSGWEFARWTGDASGPSSTSVTMDAPLETEAWFTRTSPLRPGSAEEVTLPSTGPGYRFAAPEGASAIALKFAPDTASPALEMQVRAFSSPLEPGLHAWERLHAHSHWQDWLLDADFVAKPAADGRLEVAIGYDTDPPLDPDAIYFVALVSDSTPVSGTLSLEVTSSGPRPPRARAWPRAFTFVADAGADPHPQTFELRNEGGSALQFDASSEASWLAANPPRGSIPPGGSAEISVAVAGRVPADTHAATLDLGLGGPYGPLAGQRLPVTFVAVPPPSAAAAANRPPAN